jgi:thiamine-monophosphate kinase
VTSTVTVIGEVEAERLLTRHSAQPGDAIAVTGSLGGAAAALALLADANSVAQDCGAALRRSLLRPTPRLAEARILAADGIRCGIDISDGLLGDLEHICESSHVSATVYGAKVPVSRIIPGREERLMFALTGGEDYELLFTGDFATIEHATHLLHCGVSVIGEIGTKSDKPAVSVLDEQGRPLALKRAGWGHFQA